MKLFSFFNNIYKRTGKEAEERNEIIQDTVRKKDADDENPKRK